MNETLAPSYMYNTYITYVDIYIYIFTYIEEKGVKSQRLLSLSLFKNHSCFDKTKNPLLSLLLNIKSKSQKQFLSSLSSVFTDQNQQEAHTQTYVYIYVCACLLVGDEQKVN